MSWGMVGQWKDNGFGGFVRDGVGLVGSGVQWVVVEYPVRGIFTWLTR